MSRKDELFVPPTEHDPANHYRIQNGCVQFRISRPSGGSWRTLSYDDVVQHIVLQTLVAEWLMERLQTRIDASTIPATEWLNQRIELWN
jgi:hypothetical protein